MRFRVSRSAPSAKNDVAHKRNGKDGANFGYVKHVRSNAKVNSSAFVNNPSFNLLSPRLGLRRGVGKRAHGSKHVDAQEEKY